MVGDNDYDSAIQPEWSSSLQVSDNAIPVHAPGMTEENHKIINQSSPFKTKIRTNYHLSVP
jgi:hypothetical protein